MKYAEYADIVEKFNSMSSMRIRMKEFTLLFPDVPKNTIGSICSLEYQKRMKKINYKYQEQHFIDDCYKRCLDDVRKAKRHALLKLADEFTPDEDNVNIVENIHLSPALLARNVLEKHLSITEFNGQSVPKPVLTRLLKDTSLIIDPVIANEVDVCNLQDEFYGPMVDSIRHSIGYEYELHLKQKVKEHGLVYLDEDQMRQRGYDKTPDIKLEIPIAVDGHVVNWIESKASFGDENSHKRYLKEQFWTYWNRFGPGLVIYWFGFIDELDTESDRGIMIMDRFPDDIRHMEPSCVSTG